jgi:hypothetical protein
MAMDRLHDAKPRRLRRQEGVWTLDVERFISMGQGVLRPKVEKLLGETVIVQYLAQHPVAHGLGRTATQLMRDVGTHSDGKVQAPIFEAVGEGWIPVFETEALTEAPSPVHTSIPAPPVPSSTMTTTGPLPVVTAIETPDYDALVRALGSLRLLHNKLQARVEELEQKLVALTHGSHAGAPAPAASAPTAHLARGPVTGSGALGPTQGLAAPPLRAGQAAGENPTVPGTPSNVGRRG